MSLFKQVVSLIKSNFLLKIASLNSVSIVVRMLSGFLTSKVIAIYLGPEGLALIGNFRNFLETFKSITTLGLKNGVIKYVAQLSEQITALRQFVTTVMSLFLISSLLMALGCYLLAPQLSAWIFQGVGDYTSIIKGLAVILPFFAVNMLVLSVLNGLSEYKRLIYINIVGHILTTLLIVVFIINGRLFGALWAIVLAEILLFFITGFALVVNKQKVSFFKLTAFNKSHLVNLVPFTVMAIFSAMLLPAVLILIRNYIIDHIGIQEAGYWEAMNRLSNYYLMFVTTLFTLYVLPKYSKITTEKAFRREVFGFYKTIMPLFGVGLVIIYLLRHFIINLVFTKEFLPMDELFVWQLTGDFLKILSIVIAYQFLAKKMVWHYLVVESISITFLYFSSLYCIDNYGLKGANMAHLATYVLYYTIVLWVFRKPLFNLESRRHKF